MSSATPATGPSDARDFAVVAQVATGTAILMFSLIVIGSIVRTTGSGLSCPDWPLCHGQLIPPMQFNILMEWLHRLIALVVGLGLLTTALLVASKRSTRARLGGLATMSIALYFSQALLGALTVWKLLDPNIVSGHLAVGLLLFSTLLTLGLIARHESKPVRSNAERPAGLLPLFAGSTAAIWAQAVLGGMVSTNHASLVCHDWPTCNGEWFPPLVGLVGLQMTHRFAAYLLITFLGFVAWRSRKSSDVGAKRAGAWLFGLVLLQAVIGVVNIMLNIPVWVSALHLGNAALMLAIALGATFHLSTLRASEPATSRLVTS